MAIPGAPASWVKEPSQGSDRDGYRKPSSQTGLGEFSQTPVPKNQTTYDHRPAYESAEGRAYREGLRERPSQHPENPKVVSKNIRRYGKEGSRLHLGTDLTSTGQQPAEFDRGPAPPRGNLRALMARGKRKS